MKPVCRELLGIQKTLSNIGSELLGIQENQRDANFKNRRQGRWNEAKTGVSRITRHSRRHCPMWVQNYSAFKRTQKDAMQGRWYKDFKFPRYPTKTRESSIKTKPKSKAQRIWAGSYAKLIRGPCIIIPEIDSVAESAMNEIYRRGMNSKRLQLWRKCVSHR
jgi:hypothetical protein